jgi:hypothetical protein
MNLAAFFIQAQPPALAVGEVILNPIRGSLSARLTVESSA